MLSLQIALLLLYFTNPHGTLLLYPATYPATVPYAGYCRSRRSGLSGMVPSAQYRTMGWLWGRASLPCSGLGSPLGSWEWAGSGKTTDTGHTLDRYSCVCHAIPFCCLLDRSNVECRGVWQTGCMCRRPRLAFFRVGVRVGNKRVVTCNFGSRAAFVFSAFPLLTSLT